MAGAWDGSDDVADDALVARWLRGDQRAATALVRRHGPAVARFVNRLGAGEDADDVVQDVFVRAFGALDSFRGASALRTWLFAIARRLVVDRRRAGRREPQRVPVDDADVATEFAPLDYMVAAESEGRIAAALGRLTPTQREVFLLRVVEGLSYREIAEVVGSTEGAARVHYHNAMRAVKDFVHDR